MAIETAMKDDMHEPTIVSWHQRSNDRVSTYYDGADPHTWWEKFGAGNGGEIEVSVGDQYDFVLTDAEGYETIGPMPLRNLADEAGNQFLCYTPILGEESKTPNRDACTELDGWAADQM
jgi:hypothetical protein